MGDAHYVPTPIFKNINHSLKGSKRDTKTTNYINIWDVRSITHRQTKNKKGLFEITRDLTIKRKLVIMYVNSMWIDKHSNFIQNLKQIQFVWKQREMYFGSDDSYAVPSVKNWRGCQSLSLLSVSKKNERKTKKNERFTWFWALFVIKQWSQVEGSSPNASGVD